MIGKADEPVKALKNSKISRSNEGSMTVEASLVLPLVILAIAAVFYLSFLMYQFAYTQTIVNLAAERSVPVKKNANVDIATGRISAEALMTPLYYNPFSENKKYAIKNYLQEKLNEYSIIKPRESRIDIESHNNILYQTMVIKVTETYDMPAGSFFEAIGLSNGITNTAQAKVTINEPEEMIKNVDIVSEILSSMITKTEQQQAEPQTTQLTPQQP